MVVNNQVEQCIHHSWRSTAFFQLLCGGTVSHFTPSGRRYQFQQEARTEVRWSSWGSKISENDENCLRIGWPVTTTDERENA